MTQVILRTTSDGLCGFRRLLQNLLSRSLNSKPVGWQNLGISSDRIECWDFNGLQHFDCAWACVFQTLKSKYVRRSRTSNPAQVARTAVHPIVGFPDGSAGCSVAKMVNDPGGKTSKLKQNQTWNFETQKPVTELVKHDNFSVWLMHSHCLVCQKLLKATLEI